MAEQQTQEENVLAGALKQLGVLPDTKPLDLAAEGVSDVTQLRFSNVFGQEGHTASGLNSFLHSVSAHGAQAQAAGLNPLEYEAGAQGITMDKMLSDLWDATHSSDDIAKQGVSSTDKAMFIMDCQREIAAEHGMNLGEYQQASAFLIKSSMGANYGSSPAHYNEPGVVYLNTPVSVLLNSPFQMGKDAAEGLRQLFDPQGLPQSAPEAPSSDIGFGTETSRQQSVPQSSQELSR